MSAIFPLTLHDVSFMPAGTPVLQQVSLTLERGDRIALLGAGEQQRVALARAWALEPDILFLDEPTASLDSRGTGEVERIIADIQAAGTAIVMATHNLGQARRLAGEVVFLHQGRLAERTPAAEFFCQAGSPEARAFLAGELP